MANNQNSFQTAAQPSKRSIDNQIDSLISAELRPVITQFQKLSGLPTNGTFNQATQEGLFRVLDSLNIKVTGTLTDNALAIKEALEKQLQDKATLLRQEHEEKIANDTVDQQTRQLKDLDFNDNEISGIIDSLHNATNLQDFKSKISSVLSKNDNTKESSAASDIVSRLWLLEQNKQNALSTWNKDVSSKMKNDALVFSALDVFSALQTGRVNNSLDKIAGPDTKTEYTDDRFFIKDVYSQLRTTGHVEGPFLPPPYNKPGAVYTEDNIAKIAYDILLDKLNKAGIDAPKDMGKAILEGRFVPSFDDLKLVQLAAGRPTLADVAQNPNWEETLAERIFCGLIKVPGFDHWDKNATLDDARELVKAAENGDPDLKNALEKALAQAPAAALGHIIDEHQRNFMDQFGKLSEIGTVKTVHQFRKEDGTLGLREELATADTLALNLVQRYHNPDFESTFHMSAEEARKNVENGSPLSPSCAVKWTA